MVCGIIAITALIRLIVQGLGMLRRGLVRHGQARQGVAGTAWRVVAGLVEARLGQVWLVEAWFGRWRGLGHSPRLRHLAFCGVM